MNHLESMINILSDGDWHSGAEIGNQLNLTRAAIWKCIQQLPEYGLEIESAPRKGYRLTQKLSLLNQAQLRQSLGGTVEHIDVFTSLTSTNEYLLQLASGNPICPHVCLAEHQTQGRGRRGRVWDSPLGGNIYLSVLWKFQGPVSDLQTLSLAIAMDMCRSLDIPGLGVKWPNDIYYQGKKLAGILLELKGALHDEFYLALGIGLNVNGEFSNPVNPRTSIQAISNEFQCRNTVAITMIESVLTTMKTFQQSGFSSYHQDWDQFDIFHGIPISITTSDGEVSGTAQGISENGQLLVNLPSGEEKRFSSGDIKTNLQETV